MTESGYPYSIFSRHLHRMWLYYYSKQETDSAGTSCGQWRLFPPPDRAFSMPLPPSCKPKNVWAVGRATPTPLAHEHGMQVLANRLCSTLPVLRHSCYHSHGYLGDGRTGSIMHWNGKQRSHCFKPPMSQLSGATALATNTLGRWIHRSRRRNKYPIIEHGMAPMSIIPSPDVNGTSAVSASQQMISATGYTHF